MGGSLAEEEIDSRPFAWTPIPSTDVCVERDTALRTFCYGKALLFVFEKQRVLETK